MEQVIEVWLENKPGALMRVVGVFTAKGLNIDNLIVGPDLTQGGISQMIIVAEVEQRFRVRVIKEIDRLVNVLHTRDATGDPPATRTGTFVHMASNSVALL